MSYFGIDISEHNGKVDWNKISKQVDFAILRIGWVGNGRKKIDARFFENYKNAKKAGVKLGAYVYIYSKSVPAVENGAKWVLEQIKGLKFDMPIYCDMEDPTISSLGKKTLTSITIAFNEKIKKSGNSVGVYASRYWFDYKLDSSLRTKYHTWIAHYTSGKNKYKGQYEMWQNSSKGLISGVSSKYVDTNYLYKDIFNKPISTKPSSGKPAASPVKNKQYVIGNTYTLQGDLYVRKGPGTNYGKKKRSQLTENAKKHSKIGLFAVLKKGTRITCKNYKVENGNTWIQIHSGWICGCYNGKVYIK